MLSLPDSFRQNVIAVWGKQGEEWLRELPNILKLYSQKWALDITAPEHTLNYNYVAPARLKDGTEAIIKIGYPNPEIVSEINALKAYEGKKAVKLLRTDPENGVLLLERIRPGRALTEIQERDDEEATKIAATVIRDLPTSTPKGVEFSTVAQWGEVFHRIQNKGLPQGMIVMLNQAEELMTELDQSKQEEKLLHGDLHFENILFDEKNGWVAIDPKGVIGDPVYEAARLLHNPSNLFKKDNPKGIIKQRIEILSAILNYEKERIAKWAFVDSLLATCWSIEDNGDYKNAIESAKIFQRILEEK